MLGDLEHENIIPSHIILSSYPNPFNPSTTLSFTMSMDGRIDASIYNLSGQEVEKIANEFKFAGQHEYTWDASSFPSGVYFVRLHINQYQYTHKLILMK